MDFTNVKEVYLCGKKVATQNEIDSALSSAYTYTDNSIAGINNNPQTFVDSGFDYSTYVPSTEILDNTIESIEDTDNNVYGFTYDDYMYTNDNKFIDSSSSMCRITVNNTYDEDKTFTLSIKNVGETGCDYGYTSYLDNDFNIDAYADDESTMYFKSDVSGEDFESEVTYTIPSGEHTICIKYIKDVSFSTETDYFGFRVIAGGEWVTETKYLTTKDYVDGKIGEIDTVLATLTTLEDGE